MYHYWGCTSICRPLSYTFRSLDKYLTNDHLFFYNGLLLNINFVWKGVSFCDSRFTIWLYYCDLSWKFILAQLYFANFIILHHSKIYDLVLYYNLLLCFLKIIDNLLLLRYLWKWLFFFAFSQGSAAARQPRLNLKFKPVWVLNKSLKKEVLPYLGLV